MTALNLEISIGPEGLVVPLLEAPCAAGHEKAAVAADDLLCVS